MQGTEPRQASIIFTSSFPEDTGHRAFPVSLPLQASRHPLTQQPIINIYSHSFPLTALAHHSILIVDDGFGMSLESIEIAPTDYSLVDDRTRDVSAHRVRAGQRRALSLVSQQHNFLSTRERVILSEVSAGRVIHKRVELHSRELREFMEDQAELQWDEASGRIAVCRKKLGSRSTIAILTL